MMEGMIMMEAVDDAGHLNSFLLLENTEVASVDISKVVDPKAVQVVVAQVLLMTMMLMMMMMMMMITMTTATPTMMTKITQLILGGR